jgi:hypothetical protein
MLSSSNLPLRLAGLAAGISIILLRQELDSRLPVVLLTLLVFLGPYLIIGFVPKHMGPLQVGFASGYALSMLVALTIYFVLRSFGFTTPAPVAAYKVELLLNFALLAIAVNTWIRLRNKIDQRAAFSMLALGFGYPFFAFCFVLVLGHLLLDRA